MIQQNDNEKCALNTFLPEFVTILSGSSSHEGNDFDFIEDAPHLWQFQQKLHVTSDMFPKVRVLLYFITADGEMVADTVDFDMEPCIGNNVSLSQHVLQK